MRRVNQMWKVLLLGCAVAAGASVGSPVQAGPNPGVLPPVAPLNNEGFASLNPARLLDTRVGGTTVDGLEVGAGAVGPDGVLELTVLGRGGVPAAGVGSVALHVTAVGQTERTFITVYPKGIAWPGTSNLNPVPGVVASNLVIVPIGAGGEVSLYNNAGSVQLIVDVEGWFPSGPRFTGVTPARVADTRAMGTKVGAGQSLSVQVAGVAGVPTSGVSAVVLNVTSVLASTQTFVTVYPSGTPAPATSNLNTQLANTAANLVVTPMGADGKVAIRNEAGTVHVIVDVLGWFAVGSGYNPVAPTRVADTRSTTFLAADSSRVFHLTGVAGIPSAGVGSVVFNLTAVNHTARTFLTAYSTGTPRPLSSSLNPHPGVVAPNLVISKVGVDGSVTIYNEQGTVDVILDVVGWLPSNVSAAADSLTVTEDDTASVVAVLANDVDLDGSPLTVQSVTQPAHGTAAVVSGGLTVTYAPDANYCNTPVGQADTFTYTLFGGTSATVAATVTCVEDSPVAIDDHITLTEDDGLTTLAVLTNDTDVDGGPITIVAFTPSAHGTVAIAAGGTSLAYTLTPNFCSVPADQAEEIHYTLNGGNTAALFVIVTCVDDAPVAVADAATFTEDDAATPIPVLVNDTDIDAGPKTVVSVTQPTGGTVLITGGGTGLTYQPNPNYCNAPTPTSFAYTLNGGSSASVAVTVTCVDDSPIAVNDTATVSEDAVATSIDVRANDTDADAGSKTIQSTTASSHGTVVITGGGTGVTYKPNADYCNTNLGTDDEFTYTLNGGSVGTVTVTVTCVNDVPSFVKGADQSVLEDAGSQSILSWATAISEGPANEAAQTLTFAVTGNTNTGLFASGPSVAADGTLAYTPADNASGVATITLALADSGGVAAGGVDTSASQSFTITVGAVNDAPSFTKGANQSVSEDAASQTVVGWASAISAGPSDEASQTLVFSVTGNTNTGLFQVLPAVSPQGSLSYTPAANANGSATVTLTLMDNGGLANGGADTSSSQQLTITVTAVNDAPGFSLPASPDQSVVENSAQQTVVGFATNFLAGPPNESSQALTLHVSNGNSGLFSAQPSIDVVSGNLVYTPQAGATGTAVVSVYLTDNAGTSNGGIDTSATKTFNIVVFPPNFTPVAQALTLGATEDTPKTVTLTATDADDDNLTFSIVGGPTHGGLGALSAPDCTTTLNVCTATVTYTPTGDYFGADSFTFKANDGTIDSAPATIDLNLAAVNDVPSFTKGATQTVLEDAVAQTVPAWATAISAGPNEAGQTLFFSVTGNTNSALFLAGPAVAADGTLSFTPAANANGSATITLRVADNGGTANGGVDTSATQTFVINVTAVNDAPSFNTVAGNPATVNEDAAAQTVTSFVTGMSVGPANESAQTAAFVVTANSNSALFSAGPAISPTGTLTYTPAANQSGTALVTITLQDTGGTASGGVDASPTQQFTVTVTTVNDLPTSPGRAYGTGSLQANMQRSVAAGTGLLVGAADAADVAGNAGYTPTLTVGTINGIAPVSGTITTSISGVGTVVANAATGAFTLDPAAGVTGAVSFPFTVCDTGDGAPDSQCTAPVTASFNVAGPVIWFVDPAAVTNGVGTLASPFNALSAADAVDAAGHRIFIYSGTTATGLTLNSDEWLIGQGASTAFDSLFGISPPSGTAIRPTTNTGTVTIGGTVTLAATSKVQGVSISSGASAGLVGSGAITGITVTETSVTTTTGTAVTLNNAQGTYTLSGVSTTVGSGANPAFSAVSSGSVVVTGSANVLATTTGTALNVVNTTIGASGLNFQSISAGGVSTGPFNGIVLDNTGASGGLTLTGTGVANSGGTIRSTNGAGISLANTQNVSLSRMLINSTAGSGIDGTGVVNFSLTNSTISNSGTGLAADTSNVAFNRAVAGTESNVSGTLVITGNTLQTALWHGISVNNFSGTLSSANISNNNVTSATALTSSLGNGIELQALGSPSTVAVVTSANINNNTVVNFPSGGGILAQGGNANAAGPAGTFGTPGTANKITITGNLVHGESAANRMNTSPIAATVDGKGVGNFNVSNNGSVAVPLGNSSGTVILVGANGNTTSEFLVQGNVIVGNNIFGSQGIGAGAGTTFGNTDSSLINMSILNNSISAVDGNGILAVARGAAGQLNVKIQNNTVATPLGGNRPGIRVDAGNAQSTNDRVCLNISGNTSSGSGSFPQGIGLRRNTTPSGLFAINGMAATGSPGVEAFVDGLNPAANGTLLISASTGFTSCNLP